MYLNILNRVFTKEINRVFLSLGEAIVSMGAYHNVAMESTRTLIDTSSPTASAPPIGLMNDSVILIDDTIVEDFSHDNSSDDVVMILSDDDDNPPPRARLMPQREPENATRRRITKNISISAKNTVNLDLIDSDDESGKLNTPVTILLKRFFS